MNPRTLLNTLLEARSRRLQGTNLMIMLLILEEPRILSYLAREIGISSPALTEKAERLKKLGYITTAPVSDDRRKIYMNITHKGNAAIEAILQEL